jgi:hypothetical protein
MAEEKKKWLSLPKKVRTAEELQTYLKSTPYKEKILVTLIADELRNFGMEQIIWARNEDACGLGLFEYADPYEEADRIISKLRLFGFLPAKEEEVL